MYEEIIGTRYSGPSAIITYKAGEIGILAMSREYISELWMNVSEDEFIEGFPQKAFGDEDRRQFLDAVKRCAETGEDQEVETWRLVFSNCCGDDRICLKSRLVFVEKKGEDAVIFESIRNITNEKRIRDNLEDIEYRYKSALEQINIYNWEYNIATKEMRPCYRCMRDLGLPAVVNNYPDTAIDMGIFPPDYADMYRDMMRMIDEGAPEMEADIPLTVGRVPFRVKYTTEFDESGKPIKAFGSATLISETELGHIRLDNQVIDALAEEYQCMGMANFVDDSVKVFKQEGCLELDADAECADMLKMVAQRIQDIPDDLRKQLCDVSEMRTSMFSDCEKREFEFKDDTSDKWVRIGYHVIERGGGNVDRLLVTASVIDDLRAQKMEDDRLIARQKEQLEAAIEEVNRANEAKTEFFSNLSHDIRTPMNAITGFSQLARDELDDRERLEDYLDKIVTAGEHLTSLINDILDISRIESGKMELSPSPVKLKDLLNQSADMIRVKMKENDLSFTVNVDEMEDDTVDCDKLRFDQIILNLLSNAYKYTPVGGSVFLEGRLSERGSKLKYEIRVRDTGIGMSEEFAAHIWDAYAREQSDVVNKIQGTGLGMVIVKKLLDLMGGTIELVTRQGKGSEFIIHLALRPSVDKKPGSTEEAILSGWSGRDYSKYTILVVDDTPMNLKLAERVLEKFGFKVRKATSGIEALEIIGSEEFKELNLVLMDVQMPDMDGLEATERIRAMEDSERSSIPIIAMTANAFESDVKKALDAGMDAHIPKPFKMENLISTIERVLFK